MQTCPVICVCALPLPSSPSTVSQPEAQQWRRFFPFPSPFTALIQRLGPKAWIPVTTQKVWAGENGTIGEEGKWAHETLRKLHHFSSLRNYTLKCPLDADNPLSRATSLPQEVSSHRQVSPPPSWAHVFYFTWSERSPPPFMSFLCLRTAIWHMTQREVGVGREKVSCSCSIDLWPSWN